MKTIFAITILLLSGLNCFSQTVLDTDGLNNPDNAFLYALREYCKTLDPAITKIVYVEKEHFIGDSWPEEIDGFQIEYLDTKEKYKRAIKKNKGSIIAVGIRPLNFRDGNFYVSVIPFLVTYEKRKIVFSNGGGWNIYFDYDPEKKGLIYKSKQNFGI